MISGGDETTRPERKEEEEKSGRRGGVITELRAGGVFKRAPPARFEAGPTVAFLGLGGNSWSHLRPKRVGPVDFSRPRPPAPSTLPPLFHCLPMAPHRVTVSFVLAMLQNRRSCVHTGQQLQDHVWLEGLLLGNIWHPINSKT